MQFSTLSTYFQKIENTSSRLQMTEILAQVFQTCVATEIDKICYFSLGILSPKFVGLDILLAEKLMIKVISQVTSLSSQVIIADYKNSGDLGITFQNLSHQKTLNQNQNPDIESVYDSLIAIAKDEGQGSQERKIMAMSQLLKSLDPLSGKFLVRFAVKKLRLGFSHMTILDALSWSTVGNKSLRDDLESAYNVQADIGQIAQIFKSQGISAIRNISPLPGIPVVPSRATPLFTPEEILSKMNDKTALEPKFDGFRVQIHIDKSKNIEKKTEISLFNNEKVINTFVKVYSRNLDDITFMFPDLVQAISALPVENAILDGEALAFDPKTNQLLDFQETIKRKRKHDIKEVSSEIPLRAYIFDLLYLNHQNLINLPLSDRRQKLEKVFQNFHSPNYSLCSQKIVDNVADFDNFFNQIADKGLEGLMAKKINGRYRAGKRDFTWVKYKIGMQSELADTVDAIVLGYFKGQGKWTQFGIGKVLVGIPHKDKIYALSKVGSGFSEEIIREMHSRCQKIQLKTKPEEYVVDKNLIPDVWVNPEILIEIRADSISRSPFYQTGLSLRFPRFVRFRDDKDVSEATSLSRVKTFTK